jgi:uncharacterized damage-inducible protein DinB
MKNHLAVLLAVMLCTAALAQQPAAPAATPSQTPQPKAPAGPPTVTRILHNALRGVEGEFVPAVEAMPDDKFTFAPTNGEFKGVRNFAQQARHVAATQYMVAGAILGEKPSADVPDENGPTAMTDKAAVLQYVKASFVYAHKALDSINAENVAGQIKSPFGEGQTTRLSMAILLVSHAFDHYGQMVEYLRMNNIVPPASRGQ